MDVLTAVAATVALVLTGAVAGVFFAFSTSVLPGLDAIRPGPAVAAMTSMNRAILNPLFLTSFVGPPLVAALTGVLLFTRDATAAALLFLAAAAVYVLGAIAPTAAVNVPLNNALLAAPEPTDDAQAARVWSAYSPRWTRWNHWRAVASLAALALEGVGLMIWNPAT
ncbi:anthrone oxygenase family protein [Actinophytocola xanthii]|uniref:DUF1772 domain-containing protein n=1 Tax=Actinophytocola xanthii TaxID=1912961 RepID=A0A1Q8CLZ4_9PSEU|nr:anthrone oxygenase family protein [Actinophytocola xanthii]OLF15376.1 hypothetical protein BU204_22305 [Actinophytocola xanthii]